MLGNLLDDLASRCTTSLELLVTLNVPEELPRDACALPFRVRVIENRHPKGFGANHNAAFRIARASIFCVINPDIRIDLDPFPPLVAALADRRVGVVAPLVVNGDGEVEDSARRFPTFGSLALKALGCARRLEYAIDAESLSPDWVAGMFMLFSRDTFAAVGGFDERYHLYYEDVDMCRRLRARGYDVRLVPTVRVVHLAQRASRRRLQHLRWHAASALRYLLAR